MTKQREQASTVAAAEQTLATLQAKRAAVVAHADDLAAERAAIAYSEIGEIRALPRGKRTIVGDLRCHDLR
jgi:hypothetical protein